MKKIIICTLVLLLLVSTFALAFEAIRTISGNTISILVDPQWTAATNPSYVIKETVVGAAITAAALPGNADCGLSGQVMTCTYKKKDTITLTYTTTGSGSVSGTITGKKDLSTPSNTIAIIGDSVIPNASACVPNCTGKSCGDDGCGGSCGTCSSGQTCDTSGKCVALTEICNDNKDNDNDGSADCADSDCKDKTFGGTGCQGTEDYCADGFDNDGDGKIDSADSDCTATTKTIGQTIDEQLTPAERTGKTPTLSLLSKIAGILKAWFGG